MILLIVLSFLLSCARSPVSGRASASGEAGAAPSLASVPAEEEPRDPPAQVMVPPPPSGESHRTTLASLEREPLLKPFLATLRDHFGSALGPYAMQRIELAGGRTAMLVSRGNETDPIVLAVDRDELAWSKPRPTSGIASPFAHLAIAPRSDGGVALFGYVASMRILAGRMWADNGDPYADIELARFDACDTMSAAYSSRLGWIVACTSRSGTWVQRLRGDGATALGQDGVAVGAASAVGPVTVAFDSDATWVLVQRARAVGGDHLLASRYDGQGQPLWPAPVDVGALPPMREQRFETRNVRWGLVRIELPAGLVGKNARAAEIESSGEVRLVTR
jgi:hypothetical protein